MTTQPDLTDIQRAEFAAVGEAFSFAGDRLAFNNLNPLTQRLFRRALSPSSANSLGSCPARWAAEYLLPDDDDPFAANHLGTAAHALMEDLMAQPPQQRTPEVAASLLDDLEARHELVVPANPLTVGAWRSEVATRARGLFEIEDPREVVVVGRELKVDADIGGVTLRGVIDRVDAMPDQRGGYTLVVRDYKTGKPTTKRSGYVDSGGEQQRLYTLALEGMGVEGLLQHPKSTFIEGLQPVVTGAWLYYTRFGRSRGVSVSPRDRKATQERFVGAWNTLQESLTAGSFPTVAGPLCGWCPLVAVCPTAIATGKTDRSGKSVVGAAMWPTGAPQTVQAALTTGKAQTMTSTPRIVEGNRFDETINGDLNGSSAAATAVFGITCLAAEILNKGGQKVAPNLAPLAATLADIVAEIQATWSGSRSAQQGLSTRIRGVLYSVLEMPGGQPPFGNDDPTAWTTWRNGVAARAAFIVQTAHGLWATEPQAEPWLALASTTTPAVAPAA